MQCDLWFPPVKIPLGSGQFGSPPVLVMTASHSRFICARMIPSRTTEDLCYVASRIMLNALRGPLVLAVIARKFLT